MKYNNLLTNIVWLETYIGFLPVKRIEGNDIFILGNYFILVFINRNGHF